MAIKQLNPYLNFNGNAEEAIRFYEKTLGLRVGEITRFGDVPGMPAAPEHKSRVLHAELRLGPGVLMASDTPPDHPVPPATNVHVCLDFDDMPEMEAQFAALAAGGKVTMPLSDTFWGARFGMLTDAYGVSWMFNCKK
jgi:PhnB protein